MTSAANGKRARGRAKSGPRAATTAGDSTGLRTIREVATALGVQPGQVRRWIGDGCPVAVKGGPNKSARLDLAAVTAWRAPRDAKLSVAEESARLKAADRALKEQQLRKRAGELLERGPWVRAVQGHIQQAKARLLALPAALAEPTVDAAADGPGAVEALWRKAIEDALHELAGAIPEEETR